MLKPITPQEFAGMFAPGSAIDVDTIVRSVGAAVVGSGDDTGRTISYIFSDESVARDGHTISSAGWDLANFLTNPVFLFCHDQSAPPIGRVTKIEKVGAQLCGTVEYADAETYPFADTIFRLTKGGFLNATSVSWIPLAWKYSSDKNRPGGIDFTRQELLEISAVPVPALPSALVTARAQGIDTKPLFDWAERLLDSHDQIAVPRSELEALRREARMPSSIPANIRAAPDWKCGAARDLPVDDKSRWDGPGAEGRLFDAATADGKIDPAKAKRGFLFYDASSSDERGAYKEPFADIVEGKMVAIAGGLHAAASRLDATDVPEGVRASGKEVLDAYEAKMKADKDKADRSGRRVAIRTLGKSLHKRGLYELSQLCSLVDYAEYVYQCVCWEADNEGDDSPLPARMAAWLDEGNAIIAAMAAEETTENMKTDVAREVEEAVTRALQGLGLAREGKRLSAETERCMRDAHDHVQKAADLIRGVVDPADNADPEAGDGDDATRAAAIAERRAAAQARKQALAA